MSELSVLTPEVFDEKVLSVKDKPVMVVFSAPWCVQCKMLLPAVETLAHELSDRDTALIYKMELEDDMPIIDTYNILHLPTLIIFKNGEPVYKNSGVFTLKKMMELLTSHM